MHIDNSYARLPERFYQRINPVPVSSPRLIRFNKELAADLGLELPADPQALAETFSGSVVPEWATPLAQAYAGHQFGHFVPQLGDGRAVLLAEVVTPQGGRFDIQLKGSGQTRFSRNGDGRAPLGPVIREYVVSEAMHTLGIPTTRSLAMVITGETVYRERPLPGGVLTRVAASHIRIGTFQFFAAREDDEAVRLLADHVIKRHYPHVRKADNPYLAMFEAIRDAQAELVAKWMGAGFIHGVMNTDNTAVSGETIDYGPCAFLDRYDPGTVFSSIDHQGRYAFGNQPSIMQWNLACLAGCLLPLLHDDPTRSRSLAEGVVESFNTIFQHRFWNRMCGKMGLPSGAENVTLLKELLRLMQDDGVDYTLAFRTLGDAASGQDSGFKSLFSSGDAVSGWLGQWRSRINAHHESPTHAKEAMHRTNPAFIPRNNRVEAAIEAAVDHGDYAPIDTLLTVLRSPYTDQPDHADYMKPPLRDNRGYQTFCGT